jgi:hypothetical protein
VVLIGAVAVALLFLLARALEQIAKERKAPAEPQEGARATRPEEIETAWRR